MKRRNRELDVIIQNAVYGYVIDIMDIQKVYAVGETAYAKGEDVTAAVHALLDVIATKSEARP